MTSPDYDGRPLAWGARRQTMQPLDNDTAQGFSAYGQQAPHGYADPYASPVAAPTPVPHLSNFEAAVAALNGSAPPADPNYPAPMQFHPQPAYVAPSVTRHQLPLSRPSVGPASAEARQENAPRAASFYERTLNFFLGASAGGAYAATSGGDARLPPPNGPARTGRRNNGGRHGREKSRSPTPDLDEKYHLQTPQRRTNRGYGQYDGDMGSMPLTQDQLDEEKADMSLDYIKPEQLGYSDYEDGEEEDEEHEDMLPQTQHFGLPPEGRLLRRHKTKKRVPLTAGNLVIDLKIPTRLESFLPTKGDPEMMSTRYGSFAGSQSPSLLTNLALQVHRCHLRS